jgi:hypothetical protein
MWFLIWIAIMAVGMLWAIDWLLRDTNGGDRDDI